MDTANYLTNKGFKIDFFCDNNEELWNKDICCGIKCVSLNDLLKHKDETFIMICTRYYGEIYNQLECYGINSIIVPSSVDLKGKFF